MTDEELIARLRDGCNLQQRDGERAAKRIEQLIATNEDLIAERHEWMKDSAAAWDKCEARRIDEEALEAKLEELRQALLWCSGSADFNEGGVAREGWLKVCAPLLKGDTP